MQQNKLYDSRTIHTPQTSYTFHSHMHTSSQGQTLLTSPHSHSESQHTFITSTGVTKQQLKQSQLNKIRFRKQTNINDHIYVSPIILELYDQYQKNYKLLDCTGSMNYINIKNNQQIINEDCQPQFIECSDQLQLTELTKKNLIKIFRFKFYYFRIKIKGKISPIQLFFNCPEKIQSSNIRQFISTKAEFPSKFNAEHSVQTKYYKVYEDHNLQYFQKEYLYVTFYSDLDFELCLDIIFGNPIHKSLPKKIIVDETIDLRPQTQRIIRQDKVKLNMNLKQYLLKAQKFKQIQTERDLKVQTAQENKRILQQERKTDIICQVLARESVSQFRQFQQIIIKKKKQTEYMQIMWFKLFTLLDFCQETFDKLQEIKKIKKIQAKGKLLVWQLKTYALIDVQIYGLTPKERTITKSRLLLNSYATIIKQKVKQQAEDVIIKFIKKILLHLVTLNKQQSLIRKVKRIQRVFRQLRSKKRMFRDKFWRYIRDNMNLIMINFKQNENKNDGRKHNFQIDIPLMNSLIDEFCQQARQRWMDYILKTYMSKNRAEKVKNVALNLTEPKLYEMPNEYQLSEIIEKYCKLKKML